MQVNNEFSFIKNLSNKFKNTSYLGIGDDCSGQIVSDNKILLTSTDLLIENTHFILDKISADHLAQKSLAVNLSDIAAMGGQPTTIHISLGITNKISPQYLKLFYNGVYNYAKNHNIELLGGDTTYSNSNFIINICVQGLIDKEQIKLRSRALAGDTVCVTPNIGDSSIGFNILLNQLKSTNDEYFIQSHNLPNALVKEGQFLSQYKEVHSMIDLSDGLAKDIKHIIESSNVGAQIYLDQLPLSDPYLENYKLFHKDKYQAAICGGEDYGLLFTMNPNFVQELSKKFKNKFEYSFKPIGKITKNNSLEYLINNKITTQKYNGFDHLAHLQNSKNEAIYE